MKKVIILSHQVIGILFVVNESLLKANDDELGTLVKDHLKRHYPDLLKQIDTEEFELVTVTRLTPNEIKIEIIGNDGILYIQGDIMPVWHMIDEKDEEQVAVLADGEVEQNPTPAQHVGLKSPEDLDNAMRTV